jgi:chromosome segregation ATPase
MRTPDGAVYGPVDMATLCAWATDARIIPGCALSTDKADWRPVEAFPELRLNWMVQLPEGAAYGPLNLLALWALAEESSIQRGSTLIERSTGRKALLDESSLPLIIEESRLMLAAGGVQVAGVHAVLKARNEQILALRARLEGMERELTANLALVAETQRYLVTQEDTSRTASAHLREVEAMRAERDALRGKVAEIGLSLQATEKTLKENQERCGASEGKLAEAEGKLAESERKLAESERELAESGGKLAEAGAKLVTAEALRVDLIGRLGAAERDSGRVELELNKVLIREKDQKRLHTEEVDRLTAAMVRATGELGSERAARLSGEQSRDAEIATLRRAVEQWDAKCQSALAGVQKLEADLLGREEELATLHRRSERLEADLTAKIAILRREAGALGRRVQESRELQEQAQHEMVRVREEGEARVQALKAELAAVQGDLDGLLMASDCVRQAEGDRGGGTPSSIDWLNHNRKDGGGPRLSAAEQLEKLTRKMRDSAEENETLRRTLDGLRVSGDAASREAQEKLCQWQQQVKASSGMLQQALEEIEQREVQIRLMRKKNEDRERELLARIDAMEVAERETIVVEPEVISPRVADRPAEVEEEAQDAGGAVPPDGHGLLKSVEAQLRSELKTWETLGRKRDGAEGVAKKWFARKKS